MGEFGAGTATVGTRFGPPHMEVWVTTYLWEHDPGEPRRSLTVLHAQGYVYQHPLQSTVDAATHIAEWMAYHELNRALPVAQLTLLVQCVACDLAGQPDRYWWTSQDVNEMLEHVRVVHGHLHGPTLTAKETPNGTV